LLYRKIGDTGLEASALAFGTMRFKSAENAAEIIRRGLELGMTYFDIGGAYSWKSPDENAETWVRRALEGVPRDSIVLSAKAQVRPGDERSPRAEAGIGIRNRDEMWEAIETSLRRVNVEQFDFYQLWDMSDQEQFECACRGKDCALQAMREAKEQGLVKHLGMTTHGQSAEVVDWLKEVPDLRTITIYYNFLDRYSEGSLQYARENNVGVNIMGPLRGGLLTGRSEAFARRMPELGALPVQQIALRFLLSHPGVTCVLTGANEIAHVEENAEVASLDEPMTDEQRRAFVEAFAEFSHGEPLCTGCRYCAGSCPEGLSVYGLMGLYQAAEIFGLDHARAEVAALKEGSGMDPHKCLACEKCVEACPHDLPIPDRMKRLAELVDELSGSE